MTEQDSLLTLNAIPGLGPARIQDLVEFFASASRVFPPKVKDLKAVGTIPFSVIEKICKFDRDKFLKSEYNLINKHKIGIVTLFCDDYPVHLKEIPGAPVVLYVRGRLKKDNELALAIVGARRASLYGQAMALKFAGQCAAHGLTVVSGLARGIDTAAHQGSLRSGGQTLAVLGCGLSQIYPGENAGLAEKISQNGAVLSEFPMETPPVASNFPRRNRIISGLSLGVIVVEASRRSGALITSRYACEQGREVFAVPGKIDSFQSQGCHRLIKEGAKLVAGFEDILEELIVPLKTKCEELEYTDKPGRALNGQERQIYDMVSKGDVSIDELAYRSQTSIPQLMNTLLTMELQGHIKQKPGKLFVGLN